MIALRDEGKINAFGIGGIGEDAPGRAVPAGIVLVQNAYSLISRQDEAMLDLCAAADIAWVPVIPLGGAFAGSPKVTEQPLVVQTATSLGVTPSQIGLAWLLHHKPNILLIPGTADITHLDANAAGAVKLDQATMAALDATPNN